MTAEEKRKDRRFQLLFRVTLEEANRVLAYQRSHPDYRVVLGSHLGLDHDHSTGLVRGYLDWRINRAYGVIEAVARASGKRTESVLSALLFFHNQPPAVEVLGERYGLIGKAKRKKKMVYGPPKSNKVST